MSQLPPIEASAADPCGLANVGNTCYLNTVLQCFYAYPRFREWILAHSPETNTTNHVFQEWKQLYQNMASNNVVNPMPFVRALQEACSYMNVFEQNDMHECYMMLVDRLVKDTAIPYKAPTLKKPYTQSHYDRARKKCNDAWNQQLAKEYSPCMEMLYGQFIVQITCGGCQYIHHNYEMFNNLELPLPDHNSTLNECLQQWLKAEVLNDPDSSEPISWTCSHCKAAVKSDKTTLFWKLPPFLVVTLKRFSYHSQRRRYVKNRNHIETGPDWTLEPLELVPLPAPHDSVKYNLKALGCHRGDCHFGHYYTVAKHGDQWYTLNDHRVMPAKDVMSEDVYMLFFEQEGHLKP